MWAVCVLLSGLVPFVSSTGLLLLYRPWDISTECVFSHTLRYDLSFGMGMSDTITLVLRSLTDNDYECIVEIVTEPSLTMLVVLRYPCTVGQSCAANPEMFTILRNRYCIRVCDQIGGRDVNTPYFIMSVKNKIRFRFTSNSSVSTSLKVNVYQITATSARLKPPQGCNMINETKCIMANDEYCFTSGVVCDGIKNCGVANWFDERNSDCGLPVERLGFAPVVAVIAVLICGLTAAGHLLFRCLPPLANSFFIFNANEDNRLCIDTVFKPPETAHFDPVKIKKISIIPVPSSSSNFTSSDEKDLSDLTGEQIEIMNMALDTDDRTHNEIPLQHRKTMVRTMAKKLQEKLRFVSGQNSNPSDTKPTYSKISHV